MAGAQVLRNDDVEGLSDRFLCREAENPFTAGVPHADHTFVVGQENTVWHLRKKHVGKIGNAQHRCSSARLPLVDRALSHDDIHWNVVGLRDIALHSAELEADADREGPSARRSECPVEISAAVTKAVMIMEADERRD